MNNITAKIQGLLFSEGGPVRKTRLAQLADIKPEELEPALEELANSLLGSGLSLIRTETEASLAIAPAASDAVKAAQEKELGKDIGEAGLEVLSVVLYRGPSTRAQIDYIRGVNTSSTVRNLMARGLLERTGNPLDGREYLYRPTTELLAHLGVTEGRELPEYATISSELAIFEKKQESDGNAADTANDGGSL